MADVESANMPSRPLPTYGEPIDADSNGTAVVGRKTLTADEERWKEEQLARSSEGSSLREGIDILGKQDVDPALSQKMHLVNNVS